MSLFFGGGKLVTRGYGTPEANPRRVRAIPGAVPHSPLESLVLEVLTANRECPWNHLVAHAAEHLRRSEQPGVLAALDEGFWGRWVWPVLAEEELLRLDGVLVRIEVGSYPTADPPAPPSRAAGHHPGRLHAEHRNTSKSTGMGNILRRFVPRRPRSAPSERWA
jgi:hypothetical protein